MEFILIIICAVVLIIAYFCSGIFLKFLWGWWPLLIGILIGLIALFSGGWMGAIFGIIVFIVAITGTNSWQDTTTYTRLESSIEKAFYFRD